MPKPIRVAVVGVGYLGRIHAKIYANMDNVELVAVVDADPSVAAGIAAKHNCRALTRTCGLESQIDAVSIAVPTSLHLAVARSFLEAGVPTLLEKPVAPSVAESAEIVELAKDNGALLQIGHLERFNAGVMKLAELAGSPRFIEVHRLGEFVERATDVDVVTDLMIHDIDIVLSLINSELTHISATGTRVITDHVDIANTRLEFDNGAVANVTASRVSRSQFRRIRVFSHDLYLGLNFSDQQLEQVKPGKIKSGGKFPELVHRNIEVTPQRPLNAELAHFIDCVAHNKQPLVSGDDGLLAVKVAQRVREKIAGSDFSRKPRRGAYQG
ncbi:Gfo/Idh/MocA family protein [Candidatus Spongiihabitans sp.]|uniref:Gfo/Idh/MocA family protein n=1 Tax=Candidatus Spongiihabitans sp. TaxID=3101308 RepID=UPI003C7AC9EE